MTLEQNNILGEKPKEDGFVFSEEKKKVLLVRMESYLRKDGIISEYKGEETGKVCTTVDIERLKSSGVQFRVYDKGGEAVFPKKEILRELLGDCPILTTEQIEEDDLSPKPFFYVPETIEDALDPEKIKNAEFQLGTWEFTSRGKNRTTQNTELFLTKNEEKEKDMLTEMEARVSVILYNKKYGDGYRDEAGKLMIRDAKTREYRAVSTEALIGYGLTSNAIQYRGNGKKFALTMREVVAKYLPHLKEKGLLVEQDFRDVGHIFAEKGPVTREGVSSSGAKMFNHVIHYLGKQFYGKNVEVSTLNETTGGIYEIDGNGNRKLTHLFNLFTPEIALETRGGFHYAGPERTNVRDFSPKEYVSSKQEDETDEEFETRVNFAVETLSFLPQFLRDLNSRGVSFQGRSVKDQVVFAEAALLFREEKEKYDRFLQFVKKFQNSSPDIFRSLVYGREYSERLLDISEKIPKREMESVLENYSSVLENAKLFSRGFFKNGEISEDFILDAEESVARRAKDIINVLSETSDGKTVRATAFEKREIESADPYESTEALETFSRSLLLINSLIAKDQEKRPVYEGTAAHSVKYQENDETKEGEVFNVHHFLAYDKKTGKRVHIAVQTRKFGIVGSEREPELEFDGEARLNFLVDYGYRKGDIHSIEKIDSEERSHAFSFRIDRESIDWNHDFSAIEQNDAGREEGELSLDVGSLSFGADGKPNESSVSDRVGRIVALGNALSNREDEREKGERLELYHNRRSFSREFGKAENFAKIVSVAEMNMLPKEGIRRI